MPAACGRRPMTGRSGLHAPIRELADGNLSISWDLHQSGWTRALLEPAEAAVAGTGNRDCGGSCKGLSKDSDKKSPTNQTLARAIHPSTSPRTQGSMLRRRPYAWTTTSCSNFVLSLSKD